MSGSTTPPYIGSSSVRLSLPQLGQEPSQPLAVPTLTKDGIGGRNHAGQVACAPTPKKPEDSVEPHPKSKNVREKVHAAIVKSGEFAQKVSSGYQATAKLTEDLSYRETLIRAKEFAREYDKSKNSLEKTKKTIQQLAASAKKNPEAARMVAELRTQQARLEKWLESHRATRRAAHDVITARSRDKNTRNMIVEAFRKARGEKLLPTLKKISEALDAFSLAVDTYRGYAESPCRTEAGKALNAGFAGAISYGLGKSNVFLASIDAIVLPDGYKLSDIHRGTAAAVAALGEAAVTRDERSLEAFHKKSLNGDYGRVMQEASMAGDWWADRGIVKGFKEFARAVRMAADPVFDRFER